MKLSITELIRKSGQLSQRFYQNKQCIPNNFQHNLNFLCNGFHSTSGATAPVKQCDQNMFLTFFFIFIFLIQNLLCYHSFESSRRDDSNEWWHLRIWLTNDKVTILNFPLCYSISICYVDIKCLGCFREGIASSD